VNYGLILIRWLHFTTVLFLFGALLFQYYGGDKSKFRDLYRALPAFPVRFRSSLVAASILAFFSATAWLALEAGEMGNGPMDSLSPKAIWDVLTGTTFGHIWQIHLAASLALVVVVTTRAPERRHLDVVFCLTAIILASQAWVGHAVVERGIDGILHLINQTVHLFAAGTWLGGLIAVAFALRQIDKDENGRCPTPSLQMLLRFSSLCSTAVILIILSGLVDCWFLVGNVHFLINTRYGQVLIVKLVLFSVMIGIGAFNRFVLLPRLTSVSHRQESLSILCLVVTVEQVLSVLVLVVVSVLGILSPAVIGP